MMSAHPGLLALFCVSNAAQLIYKLGAAYCYQQVFDEGIIHANAYLLYRATALLGGLLLLFATALVLQERAMSAIAVRAANRLRNRVFLKLLAASPALRANMDTSEFIDRMGGDVNAVELALIRAVPVVFVQGSLIAGSVVLLFLIEWRLASVVLLCIPMTVFISKPFAWRARITANLAGEGRARLLALTQDVAAGHLVIRVFGLAAASAARFDAVLSELARPALRAQFLTGLVARSTQVASGVIHLVVIGFGGWLAWRGYMSGGLLIAFVGLLMESITAVNNITGALPIIGHGSESLARIDDLLRRPGDVSDRPGARPFTPPRREIRFDDVSFAYGAHPILTHVSFTVRPGEKVALVGPSGGGKSTILALLARLYSPHSGAVRFDGAALDEATEASLRQLIAVVPQTPILFRGSIRDNIALGRAGASEVDIVAAARAAAVHDVITGLPEGYATEVGEAGSALSTGQRQRIAVARALVRNAPILLLDEATSALDAAAELQLNRSVASLAGDHTVFAVTHRLSSVTRFDRILVFDRGTLLQDGTHEVLLARGGLYAELWRKSGVQDASPGDGERDRRRLPP
jgi:ABC-type multidrug transport system fused ATPase/permease subunit